MMRLNEWKNRTVIVADITLNVEFRKKMGKYFVRFQILIINFLSFSM